MNNIKLNGVQQNCRKLKAYKKPDHVKFNMVRLIFFGYCYTIVKAFEKDIDII